MPKPKPAKPRVKMPKAIMYRGCVVASCETTHGLRTIMIPFYFFGTANASRLLRWLPKAIAWMEDAR